MRFRKLRARMVEKFGSVSAFSRAYGRSKQLIYNKLAGRVELTMEDIRMMCEMLEIQPGEIGEYFFAD